MEIPAASWSAGRAYHFLTHAVAPRPIAWITTLGEVVNAAPFSWFQAVCADPPTLMVAINTRDGRSKDTSRNLQDQGECVVHIVPEDMAKVMVQTSADYPANVSEIEACGLATTPSRVVQPPRLVGPPVAMECTLDSVHRIGATEVLYLRIVHAAIADDAMDARGNLDPEVRLVARLGGTQYVATKDLFSISRPDA